jgi:membrane protein DedA with SNARE-associated domain
VGYALGSRWTLVERYFRPISIVVATVIVVALGWWLIRRSRQKHLDQAEKR